MIKYILILVALGSGSVYYYYSTRPLILQDSDNGLMWEISTSYNDVGYISAEKYCNNLELQGYDDWRVPTVRENRTIIRECPNTVKNGKCRRVTCDGCKHIAGHCYREKKLQGVCGRYWAKEDRYNYYMVDFNIASITMAGKSDSFKIKCVRTIR